MKPSGIEWAEEIPVEWQVKPLFAVGVESRVSNAGGKQDNLLSLSFGEVVEKDINSNDGLLPESFDTYQIIKPNDLVFRFTDLQNDKRSLRSALCNHSGIITSAYMAFTPRECEPRFLAYLMRSYDLTKVFYAMGSGLRQSLKYSDVKRLPIILPPIDEQKAIADFLDRETAQIDNLIAKQELLIATLGERRKAVILSGITRGINPRTELRSSGVAWLGDVPSHWDVVPIRWLSPVKRGSSPRPIDDPKYFDESGRWAWVRIADATASDGTLTSTKETLSELGSMLSTKIQVGELFVSIAGTVGKPCIAGIECCIHDGFVYFPSLKIDPKFLFWIFESGACFAGLGKLGTQLNLNTDTIGSIRVPVPPAHEVVEILSRIEGEVSELERLVQSCERFIAILLERRQALISSAVTGKISLGAG